MANVVGAWSITTDWGCDGSITGTFNQTFNKNGTWNSTPFVHSGRWYQVEGLAVWTVNDTPNLVYAANLSSNWMTGVQGYETAGGTTGCFSAHRVLLAVSMAGIRAAKAKAPAKAVAKRRLDAVLGR